MSEGFQSSAGTILHCSLIVTEHALLSTRVGCHLVSGLGTVFLMKRPSFYLKNIIIIISHGIYVKYSSKYPVDSRKCVL